MDKIQTQKEWETEMSEEILSLTKSELYLELRFLDVALSELVWKADASIETSGTDGRFFYYSPEQQLRVFPVNSKFLNRAYLHSVLHCIFSHLWLCGGRERNMWDLACDIVTEYTIDHLDKNCTRRALSLVRQEVYQRLEKEGKQISAAVVYRMMQEWYDEDFTVLHREFYTDTHKYWPSDERQSPMAQTAQQRWDKLSRQTQMQMQMESRGEENADGQELLAAQIRTQKSRRSYRDFLRKFAVLREEMRCDPDEFDMNYYSYGLRVFGNMPLIEPLESRETMKIQDFAVVVDTSYSTGGDLVKAFLKETFALLAETDSFFHKSRIHIIQCDDQVQSDEVVTNREELEALLQHFTLKGGGGTDFRPAFAWVDRLIREGELKELKGMLYFTDGKGVYPKRRPDYQTAFLFLEDYNEMEMPPWAMHLRLEPEEFVK